MIGGVRLRRAPISRAVVMWPAWGGMYVLNSLGFKKVLQTAVESSSLFPRTL